MKECWLTISLRVHHFNASHFFEYFSWNWWNFLNLRRWLIRYSDSRLPDIIEMVERFTGIFALGFCVKAILISQATAVHEKTAFPRFRVIIVACMTS